MTRSADGRKIIKIPKGMVAYTPNEAKVVAEKISSRGPWVLKAQIQSGARKHGYFLEKEAGRDGGIRTIKSKRLIYENAAQMLGSTLVTMQTGPLGKKVSRIYVEAFCKIESSFYIALAVSRVSAKLTLLVAKSYDGDILKIALNDPDKILKINLDLDDNINITQVHQVIDFLGLNYRSFKHLEQLINALHKAFLENDATMIEINPVGVMKNGALIALDAKISFDDNALYRHKEIFLLKDDCEISEREQQANHYKFTYSELKMFLKIYGSQDLLDDVEDVWNILDKENRDKINSTASNGYISKEEKTINDNFNKVSDKLTEDFAKWYNKEFKKLTK